ncbi:MAG: tetratricopeptide repeat protein [Candidatus Dependentiae bacterium]
MKLKRSLLLLLLAPLQAHTYDLKELSQQYLKKAERCKADDNMQEALQHYKNAISLNPDDFMLTFNTANELYNQGHHKEAVDYYNRAAKLSPHVEQVYFNRGVVLTQMKKHEQAADSFMQAINTKPTYAKAYVHAGRAFEECGKHDQAINIYHKGIEINPKDAALHHRLGLVYKHLDRFEEAIEQLRIATQKNPYSNTYKLELANALHLIDGSWEALQLYEKILEQNPNNHHVLYNFGYTLKKMGYIERALEVYDRVLEKNPDYALARFSRSITYLTLEDWYHGWPEYEWRWTAYNESPKKFDCPVWDGCDIAGQRILIYAEQGLGDTIQFVRYAELIKNLGAYVIVQTQEPLKDLLKLCPYIDEVYARGEPLPQFDTHIAMMSLPMVFKTEIETTPDNVPYIFAKPELVAYWADQLKDDHNFKIGICWQGNPNYRTQFLRQAVAGKSMHVNEFAPIARLNGVSLYNLQKMGGEEQLKELADDIVIRSFGPDLDSEHGRFMDTVAIMKNLDLIITIDTGTCHVAAALGVPTWNLLPNPADWRWMLDRNDTPWYNNMRLFKQPKPGDWAGAIEKCKQALIPILRGEKTVEQVTAKKGRIKQLRPYQAMNQIDYEASSEKKDANRSVHEMNTQQFTFDPIKSSATSPVAYHEIQKTKAPQQTYKTSDVYQKAMQKLTKEHPEVQQFMEQRQEEMNLNTLTSKLIAINKQLWQLDNELKETDASVFNDKFVELANKIAATVQHKQYIKHHISQLTQQAE